MTSTRPEPIRFHIERSGEFTLPFGPRQALAYLSPEGERVWVPDWQPVYLHPATPSHAPGTVFQTHHNAQNTTWLILEFDPGSGRARYGRFTEGSHLGTVSVDCGGSGNQTTVRVGYALTALTSAGVAVLEAMSDTHYPIMLGEWKRLILEAHARSPIAPE